MCSFVQGFKPDYTAPAPLLELGHVPLHFRGNWGISQREHRFITVVPADSTYLDDHYPLSSTSSFICCRSLVLIVRQPSPFSHSIIYITCLYTQMFLVCNLQFMALLILRHTLPLILTGSNLHVFPLFTVKIIIISGSDLILMMMITICCFWVAVVVSEGNRDHATNLCRHKSSRHLPPPCSEFRHL